MRANRRMPLVLIERNPELRELLASILDDEGYVVAATADATNGLAVLRAASQRAVVVLDVVPVPKMTVGADGLACLYALMSDPPLARQYACVVMTSSPEWLCTMIGLVPEALAATIIRKPFELDELLAAVDQAARHLATTPPLRLVGTPYGASEPPHRAPQNLTLPAPAIATFPGQPIARKQVWSVCRKAKPRLRARREVSPRQGG